MAIVLFGGTYAVQPSQGEMRRFITRTRVDGTTTRVKDSGTDTNKVLKINKNWVVESVWVNVIQPSSDVHFGGIIMYDSNGDTFGPYIPLSYWSNWTYWSDRADGTDRANRSNRGGFYGFWPNRTYRKRKYYLWYWRSSGCERLLRWYTLDSIHSIKYV